MIRFYWNLGKDMDLKKSEYDWGSHFYSRISEDLKKELPGIKSFSPRNLLYMHQFFRLFPDAGITHQVVAQLDSLENTQQPVAQLIEKELKDALMNKAEKFLMELGTGFALMGREVRLEVGDTEKYLDMLFYNTRRHCYVVVEVKAVDFDSSFAGQLGTYVVAVNHQIKTELDNPTIGLLICKGMDKVEAQYALESTSQPLGISSYELSKLIPEDFKGSMPTIEEIEAELSDAIVDSENKGGEDV